VTGRIYSRASESSWDAEALANGINVDLPPQERVLLIVEQSALAVGESTGRNRKR
jgi:hypothetical protein